MRAPHPIPYQGSKRLVAERILAALRLPGGRARRFVEPCAGSAAMTVAVARADRAEELVIGESLPALGALWRAILDEPEALAARYAALWEAGDYEAARARYNRSPSEAELLYLLARCVKSAPRWNRAGEFNQSADRRRRGARPERMRREILGAHALLAGRTRVVVGDFARTVASAGPRDFVYLDPPWQGTSTGRDTRYHAGLSRERLVSVLADLDARGVPYAVSYDGRCGGRRYGEELPLPKLEIVAGRSAQATLVGKRAITVESLYLSR